MDFLIRDAGPRGKIHPVMKMPVGVGVACQRLIPTGERCGLLMRIAATESVWLCVRDEKLTALLELESAIRACGE